MKLIYADFMKCDYENRLLLTTLGTHNDLAKYDLTLKNGLHLVFYNPDTNENGVKDDLVVEGTVVYDEINDRWAAEIVWEDIKNISKLSSEEKLRLGIE